MTDPVAIKSDTLHAGIAVPVPKPKEERKTGDCTPLGNQGTEPGHEGDGLWRSECLLEPGKYMQASDQWIMKGRSKIDPRPHPPVDEALRSQDRIKT